MSVLLDRVLETSTTVGTGTLSLGGPPPGFLGFVQALQPFADKTVYYCISDDIDFEIGRGTAAAGLPDTLSRDSVLLSTNSNNKVNWQAGTRNVFATLPAAALRSFVDHLASNGFISRTALNTYAARSIQAGTDINVTNGDGVAGNPTIALGFPVTAYIKTLLDDVDAAAARGTLGLGSAAVLNQGTGSSDLPSNTNLLPGIRASNQTAILNAPVKTISAAYTVLAADNGWLLERDASAGNDTVTLPAVSGLVDGWVIGIKKTDATPNAVTIDANGSELIDGLLTLSLLNQYDTIWLAKKSGAWTIISNYSNAASGAGQTLLFGVPFVFAAYLN